MMNEVENPHQSQQIEAQLRKVFADFPNIRLALLFGSMATNKARVESDIDIAVDAGQPLTVQEKINLIEEIALATGRPVDLVDLTLAGEPLLGQILAKGRRIQGSNTVYATLIIKHLGNETDFVPYRNRIIKERRQAWIGQ